MKPMSVRIAQVIKIARWKAPMPARSRREATYSRRGAPPVLAALGEDDLDAPWRPPVTDRHHLDHGFGLDEDHSIVADSQPGASPATELRDVAELAGLPWWASWWARPTCELLTHKNI
jgi:hypothetical protein